MKRFQECNRIEKIWRYRWYLLIPFKFFYHYRKTPFNSNLMWSILVGKAHSKMKWYFTSEEVKKLFNNIKDKRKEKIKELFNGN